MIKIPKSLDELKSMITDHGILDAVKANAAKMMQSSASEPLTPGADAIDQLKKLIEQQLDCVKSIEKYVDNLNHQLIQLQTKITELETPVAQSDVPPVVEKDEK